MKIHFLGTAGPATVPRPLCACHVCEKARRVGVPYSRSGPGMFVEGPNIVMDTSEDIGFQLNRAGIGRIDGVVYSHWHPDHTAGHHVLERINANYCNHAPRHSTTDVYLPEQVAADFDTYLGLADQFRFYETKGWIRQHRISDGEAVWLNGTSMMPFRLAERFAYGFLIEGEGHRVVLVPDETVGWKPDAALREADLAVLPIGVFEHHPLTGERMVASSHPVLETECLFPETLSIVAALSAKRTVLTHINGLGFDELKALEAKLQGEGLNIEIAYDTLSVHVE